MLSVTGFFFVAYPASFLTFVPVLFSSVSDWPGKNICNDHPFGEFFREHADDIA